MGWSTNYFIDARFDADEKPYSISSGEAHLLVLSGTVELTIDGEKTVILGADQKAGLSEDHEYALLAGEQGVEYMLARPVKQSSPNQAA